MEVSDWLGEDNTLGIDIWNKKYRHGDESFDAWLDRVSGGDSDIRRMILERKFLFGGRILANRGLDNHSTLSNCYCLEVGDSIQSIFNTARDMAETYKAGGGVGVDISSLAPSGARINNPAETSSGAVSFIDLFTTTTSLISQKKRRGALMISISCDHPDILDFIQLKTDVDKATSANLSIRVTDDFMKAVENDEDWFCSFTRKETGENISHLYRARSLFKLFCDANYDYGEPGLLFWDTINKNHMQSENPDFKYVSVNPCAEEPLPAGGACLLGSLNLSEYVIPTSNAIKSENRAEFDYSNFRIDVRNAIRALSTVQDEGIENHPLNIQKKSAKDWKQIGLGIMGLGDMLIKLGLRYGSEESLEVCDHIAMTMAYYAVSESIKLGEERGSFARFDEDSIAKSNFYNLAFGDYVPKAMRNSQLLSIAPTGSISTMLGVSGGIEPLFALEYTRTTKSLDNEDVTYTVVPKVVEDARKSGNEECLVCAQTIPYEDRIRMQAVWQKYIDGAISSTINLPEDFPRDKIYDLYMMAWKEGLKGVTVFRDGCKRAGVLNVKKEEPAVERKVEIRDESNVDSIGLKRTLMTGCGTLHCLAFFDKETGDLLSLYDAKGSTGGCQNFMVGLSRMVSLSARAGCSIEDIVDQLKSCGSCPSYAVRRATKGDTSVGSCCPVAIGNALIEMHNEVMKNIGKYPEQNRRVEPKKEVVNPCPQCGCELVFSNGCRFCPSCAWQKCD